MIRILVRYFRRKGLRWGAWGVRFGCVAWGVASMAWLLDRDPSGAAIVAVTVMYAIYAITEALKSLPRSTFLTLLRADNVDADGGHFHIASRDLDDAVCRIVKASVPTPPGDA